MIRRITAALLMSAGAANASVLYNWQTIGGSERELVGQLEFTSAAAQAGSINYQYEYPPCGPFCPQDDYNDPSSPVIAFRFRAIGANDLGGIILNYHLGLVGQEDGAPSGYHLALGPTLSGDLFAGGGANHLEMGSAGDVFALTYFNEGDFSPCSAVEPEDATLCAGVTGRWVRAEAAALVPAPSTLALVGLGLIGWLRTRR